MDYETARAILGTDVRSDGSLYCLGRYLRYTPGDDTACLDADFTADELEAIAWWMRSKADV